MPSPLPGGRLLVTLRLNNLVEVVREILRFGPNAEVLAPPELRTAVREKVRAMHTIYAADEAGVVPTMPASA